MAEEKDDNKEVSSSAEATADKEVEVPKIQISRRKHRNSFCIGSFGIGKDS